MRTIKRLTCLLLIILAFPAVALAAQTGGTLRTGRVYTFTSLDARTITYVSVPSGAQYEYVSRDAGGEVVDFGVSTGRFPVRGGGTTAVSLQSGAAVSVSYDNAKLSLKEAAGSALARVTVKPGESVKLSNPLDTAVRAAAGRASGAGNVRYDCAVYDAYGGVNFFMDEARYTALSVPSGGSAVFTAQEGGLTLTYPSAWAEAGLAARPVEGEALVSAPLLFNRCYALTNASTFADAAASLSGGGALVYDYIQMDAWGRTADYGRAVSGTRIAVGAGQTLYVTPISADNARETGTSFIYPASFSHLTITEGGPGALTAYTVNPGESLTAVNNSNAAYTFKRDPARAVSALDYILTGGPYAEPVYEADMLFYSMTVEAGETWTFTVTKEPALILWLPALWLREGLRIENADQPALSEYALAPGASLRLENKDAVAVYNVSVAGVQTGRGLVYDYVTENGNDTRYEADCGLSQLSLPPGAALTLTAGRSEPLTVRLPAAANVETRETKNPALTRFNLAPGASALTVNGAALRGFTVTAVSAAANGEAALDFALKDSRGQITDFGGMTGLSFDKEVEAGGSLLLTNTGPRTVTIAAPAAWQDAGLRTAGTTAKALYRQTLTENQSVSAVSQDRRYDHAVRIERTANAAVTVRYDYLIKNNRAVVLDYGENGEGRLSLPAGGTLVLMPQRGVTLSLCYPAEWQNRTIKVNAAVEPPLYRETLLPNRRLKLSNTDNKEYLIQIPAGQYYRRYDDETGRTPAGEPVYAGALTIPARTAVTITVTPGADVEIRMPMEWAKKMGIVK